MEPTNQNDQSTDNAALNNPSPTVPTPQVSGKQTGANEFRKDAQARKDGQLITLSSGHTLRIARPSVNNLVKSGQLPSELANAAIKMQSGGTINDTDMKRYVEYNERIVKLSVVSPKITENPNYDNDEISIDDLDDNERSEILLYVNGGLEALAKFRSDGSSVPTGSDLS